MKPKAGEFWIVEHHGDATIGRVWRTDPICVWELPGYREEVEEHNALRVIRKIDVGALLDQPAPGATEEWAEVTDGTTKEGDRFSYVGNSETGVGQITSHKRRVAPTEPQGARK